MGRPGVAAILSAMLPGLGQAWLGARRRGALIALPIVAGLGVLGLVAGLDPVRALDTLLAPGVLGLILIILLVVAAYHLAAVADAFRLAGRAPRVRVDGIPMRRPRRRGSPVLVITLAIVTAAYGSIELVGVRAYQAATAIFADPSSGFEVPTASFTPGPSSTPTLTPSGPATEPPAPTPTPVPVPAWAADGRLNLLLVGSDAGPGRWLARMDTLVVLSVETATGRAALFSIPRYLANVPLPPESAGAFRNGRFPGYINALYVYAMGHPTRFPGGEARGFRAVAGAVQELVGVPLDGAIVVNLNGFVDLVDAVGGLWIDIPFSVYDPRYPLPDGRGYKELNIRAGCQKLDGEEALEYARTRHQDSDFGRMRRQQRVLVALARQLDPIGLLPRVPDLLEVARDNLWTTIQPNDVAELAVLAAHVDASAVQTFTFWPPTTPQFLDDEGIAHIRDTVGPVFDGPGPEPTATPDATPKPCPRP